MLLYLAALCLILIGQNVCGQYDISPPIPIINPEPGFRYNPAGPFQPNVKLEMYLDLNCPDARDGLPIVKNVADHYGNSVVNLVVQLLPLPYHRNGFLSAQGLFLIRDHLPLRAFNFIDALLISYPTFSTASTVNMTETEVLGVMADLAVESTGIDRALFISNITNYRPDAAFAWKYSIKKLNAASPTYHVNEVDLLIGGYPTFDDWIKFLDPIIKAPLAPFNPVFRASEV